MNRCVSLVVVVPLVFVALSGCKKPAEAFVAAKQQPKITVTTHAVETRKVPESLPMSGALEAIVETDLAANVAGKVVATLAERGQAVKKSEPLVLVDTRLAGLQAAASRAIADASEVELGREKKECDRVLILADAGAIAAVEQERQTARCKAAERTLLAQRANASAAAQMVSDGRVLAPFSGHIVERWVDVGEYVRLDTKVVTLVQLDPLRVRMNVPEVHLAALVPGRRVEIRVAAFPTRVFEAKLTHVTPSVRTQTRDVVAEATIANGDHALLPGMFVNANIEVGQLDLPVIARSAVVLQEGASHVFAFVNNRIEERAVQLGPNLGEYVAVIRGVKEGEKIVENPTKDLKNGALAEEQ